MKLSNILTLQLVQFLTREFYEGLFVEFNHKLPFWKNVHFEVRYKYLKWKLVVDEVEAKAMVQKDITVGRINYACWSLFYFVNNCSCGLELCISGRLRCFSQ